MRNWGIVILLLASALFCVPALAQAGNDSGNNVAATAQSNSAGNSAAPAPQPAATNQTAGAADTPVLPESGRAIVKLFVLAALLESALALLFNWRPFVVSFDGRAVKPLVSLAVALIVVLSFGLHTIEDLLEAYGGGPMGRDGRFFSQIIEAMIIAGGSSGVNNLLRTLGFRAVPSAEQPPQPPKTEAWLAVALHRVHAVGPVQVVAAPAGTLGTINGTQRKSGLASFFLRDKGRLPGSGGKVMEPGKEYSVTVNGTDAAGNALKAPAAQKVTLAPGAIVDLEFTL
jgi:hypothetical protein